MRRLLIGLLILGGVIAAIAFIVRRRSGSGIDEWDSRSSNDWYAQASTAATTLTDAAKDAASKATDAAKDAASKATDAAKDA
jgi:hypothetical protein